MDIQNVRFTACAYFYRLKDDETITEKDVSRMLREVTAEKVRTYALDIMRQPTQNGCLFSLRVFKNRPSKPSFFKSSEAGWEERRIGYFLFVEYKGFVAILRRYSSVPKFISDKLEGVDYTSLLALHSHDDTAYQKVSAQNLDGSDYALRNKSYEGLDIKNNVSAVGISRYYLRSIKGRNGESRFALTLNTSRINEFEADMTVDDIIKWVAEVVDRISVLDDKSGDFLSMFAKPEKYSEVCSTLEPKSLLIFYGLISMLKDEQFARFVHTNKKGVSHELTNDVIQRYIDLISRALVVQAKHEKDGIHYFAGTNNAIEIVKRKKDIKLSNDTWKRITIFDTDKGQYDGTFDEIVNKHHQFSVYFAESSLVYNNGKLFRDEKLLGSIPQLIKVLRPWEELKETKNEKYPSKTSIASMTGWGSDSIFQVVEDKMPQLGFEYVICDDCKTEWADHIAIKDDTVCFLAEKWKDSKNSASDFQDVVGQALKNLGNMTPSSNALSNKISEWKGMYLTSSIPRFRSTKGTVDDAVKLWMDNVYGPGFRREMALVVNFLNKDLFKRQLMDIYNGRHVAKKEELLQRLWILSTFVNSCLEMGVQPIIYCKP